MLKYLYISEVDNKVDVDMAINANCTYFSTTEIKISL